MPQQWIIFEGICRETNKSFLLEVPNHTSKTLINVIKGNIIIDEITFSDCWREYNTVELMNR